MSTKLSDSIGGLASSGWLVGALLGGMAPLVYALMKEKTKMMTAMEKAALALVVELSKKIEEYEKRVESLVKRVGEKPTAEAYKSMQIESARLQGENERLHKENEELRAKLSELTAPKTRRREVKS